MNDNSLPERIRRRYLEKTAVLSVHCLAQSIVTQEGTADLDPPNISPSCALENITPS